MGSEEDMIRELRALDLHLGIPIAADEPPPAAPKARREPRANGITSEDIEEAFDDQNRRLDDLSSAITFAEDGHDDLIELLKKAGINMDSKEGSKIRDAIGRDFPEPVDDFDAEIGQVLTFLGLDEEDEDDEEEEGDGKEPAAAAS
jgi:hypothetical protein